MFRIPGKRKKFNFSLRNKPFVFRKYWLHFNPWCINRLFLIVKIILIALTFRLISCSGHLVGQISRKLNIVKIGLDIRTRFPSEQLSGFLLSMCQSAILFLFKIVQYEHFFYPHFENLIDLNCQQLCIRMIVLYFRNRLFPKLPAAFHHQDVKRQA